jgi:putative toxin-antitoxin system antitoxin component (TIGR02293 family)
MGVICATCTVARRLHFDEILSMKLMKRREPAFPADDEAEWAARVTRVTERSKQVFTGKPGYSGEWLCTPNPALEGHTPLQALETESGFHAVEDLLARIEGGMFA